MHATHLPNAIAILQQQAATKRDEAIKAARAEFNETLRLLDELSQRLFYESPPPKGRKRERKRPIIDLIVEIMPKDRPFPLREVLAKLRKDDPKRMFHEPTVRTLFKRLIDQGLIRKVRKGDRGFILWAAADCPAESNGPLSSVSIADAVEYVLQGRGPMRPVEVVLGTREK